MIMTNSKIGYGIIAIILHWVMAVIIIALFILGEYMVDLDYYDPWYHLAPWWHKSFGISIFVLLFIRWFWRLINTHPEPLPSYKKWEVKSSKIVHLLFYALLFITCLSGYFIATAKGVSIEVFTWFKLPAITVLSENQADIAANIHELVTHILVALFFLHIMAAFKHHFMNKDITLVRMLKPINSKEKST